MVVEVVVDHMAVEVKGPTVVETAVGRMAAAAATGLSVAETIEGRMVVVAAVEMDPMAVRGRTNAEVASAMAEGQIIHQIAAHTSFKRHNSSNSPIQVTVQALEAGIRTILVVTVKTDLIETTMATRVIEAETTAGMEEEKEKEEEVEVDTEVTMVGKVVMMMTMQVASRGAADPMAAVAAVAAVMETLTTLATLNMETGAAATITKAMEEEEKIIDKMAMGVVAAQNHVVVDHFFSSGTTNKGMQKKKENCLA
jgi:hypothetical protein